MSLKRPAVRLMLVGILLVVLSAALASYVVTHWPRPVDELYVPVGKIVRHIKTGKFDALEFADGLYVIQGEFNGFNLEKPNHPLQ